MKPWIAFVIVLAGFALLAVVGCAAKRPMNYKFTGCKVTQITIDANGQSKDCECKNGRQIGWDAKSRMAIIRCN